MNNQTQWKKSQSIGQNIQNQSDRITCLEFSNSGNLLAAGDNQGRVILFEKINSDMQKQKRIEMGYLTEFLANDNENFWQAEQNQSQYVKQIQWLKNQGNNYYMVTSNSEELKFWKVLNKYTKKILYGAKFKEKEESNKLIQTKQYQKNQTEIPPIKKVNQNYQSILHSKIQNFHQFCLEKFSLSSNLTYLITNDILSINLIDLEKNDKAFEIFQISKQVQEYIIEQSKFHNKNDFLIFMAFSNGLLNMTDMREKLVLGDSSGNFVNKTNRLQEDFADIQNRISDFDFSECGNYIVARKLNKINVFDIRKPNNFFIEHIINQNFDNHLMNFYETGDIMPKFKIQFKSHKNQFLTGFFNDSFAIYQKENFQQKSEDKKNEFNLYNTQKFDNEIKNTKPILNPIEHITINKNYNLVATANQNKINFYYEKNIEQLNYIYNNSKLNIKQINIKIYQLIIVNIVSLYFSHQNKNFDLQF